ncbi:MAG TPA: ABC transporter ATP-binding protein, partial [Bacillota bacterium]|nr:ABC transporter ATP-binding protein [Bacillota bacterium]
ETPMKLVLKYLKPFTLFVIVGLLLLFTQAMADLSLPNLMSNIVNVGIQQGGIKDSVPIAISEDSFDLVSTFISDKNKEAFRNAYKHIEPGSAEAARYIDSYPLVEQTSIYIIKEDADYEAVADMYGRSALAFIVLMQELATEDSQDAAFDEEGRSALAEADIDALHQLLPMLRNMPEESLTNAIQASERADSSMYSQVGISFTRVFYEELGTDMQKMQRSYIYGTGAYMLLIALLGSAAAIGVGLLSSRVGSGLARDLRQDVFKRVESFSLEEFDKFSTSTLITRTTNDITQIQMLATMGLRMLAFAPIMGIGGIIMALNKSLSLSWIIAVAVIVLIGVVAIIFTVALPKFKLMQKLVDRLNLVTRESLSGMLVIRAFGNQEHEEERFEYASGDFRDTNRFTNRVMNFMWPSMILIMNLSSLAIVWVGAHQIESSAMQIGDMMAFIQYAMHIIMSFLMISMIFIMLPRATVSLNRIAEILDTQAKILDIENPLSLGSCKGELAFEDVSFRYRGAENDVLCNISFTARPGETTAIIGSTGSGKSTLIQLIPRFYDVTGGRITIDGVDIRDISQHELREHIGYIPQRAVLFSGDIKSNIRYGKDDASEQDILLATEVAQIKNFVEGSEKGLDTEIAQGGSNVSGGQRQRLTIARALVKKAPILIFDDSFSALDFKTDAALRKALTSYTSHSTVLIVAQRINTIMNAEQIIVLDEGNLAGIGRHRDLLKTCKAYREIAESQLSEEDLA